MLSRIVQGFVVLWLLTASLTILPDIAHASAAISSAAPNMAPTLNAPSVVSVRAGSSVVFMVNATDYSDSNETLTLSATGLPTGATFPQAISNPAVSTFYWAPAAGQPVGDYVITIIAKDNGASPQVSTSTVIVRVARPTSNPSLTVPGPQSVSANAVLSFAVVATDTNIPPLPLTISASGLPPGATFDSQSSVFSWKPAADQAPGVYVVIFAASNGQGQFDAKKVTINVSGSPVGAATLTTLQSQTLAWILPVSIGILLGAVPWLFVARKRRAERLKYLPNRLPTTEKGVGPVSEGGGHVERQAGPRKAEPP